MKKRQIGVENTIAALLLLHVYIKIVSFCSSRLSTTTTTSQLYRDRDSRKKQTIEKKLENLDFGGYIYKINKHFFLFSLLFNFFSYFFFVSCWFHIYLFICLFVIVIFHFYSIFYSVASIYLVLFVNVAVPCNSLSCANISKHNGEEEEAH